MAVDVDTGPPFRAKTLHALFTASPLAGSTVLFQYDVSRGGDRILMIAPVTGAVSVPVTVVLNWDVGLRK